MMRGNTAYKCSEVICEQLLYHMRLCLIIIWSYYYIQLIALSSWRNQ
jgi:hypothetical protein